MARSTSKASAQPPSKKILTSIQIERGIARLNERIAELRSFNAGTVPEGTSPELSALSAAVHDTLDRCFGEGTAAFQRFGGAMSLNAYFPVQTESYPQRHHYQEGARENISHAVALLLEAQRTLREDLADAAHEPAPDERPAAEVVHSRKVFVVHGHDQGARETVARFLERIGFEPIILHEQANQGRTVIEKVEAHGGVGFAVVLLTPDDEGSVRGGDPEPRARQNVLLELGYFIGRLGRAKVCALKRGALDIPSDFAGVVWEAMDDAGGWKSALGRELQAAGHEVDWNKVMRP